MGQSHEKVHEILNGSFGPTQGAPTVPKILLSPVVTPRYAFMQLSAESTYIKHGPMQLSDKKQVRL
jgi:hypothetical protein